MSRMPPLEVPDQLSPYWPPYLYVSADIEKYLDSEDSETGLVGIMAKTYDSFGKKEEKRDVPEQGAIPSITLADAQSEMFKSYSHVVHKLEQTFDELQTAQVNVKNMVKEKKDSWDAAQERVGELVKNLSDSAAVAPPQGMREDEHILAYTQDGMDKAVKVMEDSEQEASEAAEKISGDTEELERIRKELDELKALGQDGKNGSEDPGSPRQNPKDGGLPDPPPAEDAGENGGDSGADGGAGGDGLGDPPELPDLRENGPTGGAGDEDLTPDPPDPGDQLGDSAGSGQQDGAQRELEDLRDQVDRANQADQLGSPGMLGNGSSPMGDMGGAGGMGGMGDMLNQIMMQKMMQDAMSRNGMDDRLRDLDPEDQLAMPVQQAPPPPAAQAVAPGTPQSAAPAAPVNHAAPQDNTQSNQPVGGAPAPAPGDDGLVPYTFKDDGRTIGVSPAVVPVLDAAVDNKEGTDAQQAYASTPSKWTNDKQIGVSTDPSQLMTGDVATWDATDPGKADGGQRTAVVVSFGPENPLECIVNGKLTLFTADLFADESMEFSGFAHPAGIEPVGGKNADGQAAANAAAAAGSADPSAAAQTATAAV